jgi:hypothetical protein
MVSMAVRRHDIPPLELNCVVTNGFHGGQRSVLHLQQEDNDTWQQQCEADGEQSSIHTGTVAGTPADSEPMELVFPQTRETARTHFKAVMTQQLRSMQRAW